LASEVEIVCEYYSPRRVLQTILPTIKKINKPAPVADEVSLPFDQISLEMIYRGLYHFYLAHQRRLH
jgi:hypothetical protein